jgi:uncharacterized protein (TIGR02300 family)
LADPALGTKQICPNDQTKFYDLNRRPAVCPKCGFQFDPEEALKARVRTRTRSPAPDYEDQEDAAKKPDAEVDTDAEELEEADDTPEIDQAADEPDVIESDDDGGEVTPAAGGDDLGVDFEEEGLADEDDEAVPFLEDDDDDFGDDDIEGLPEEGADDDR